MALPFWDLLGIWVAVFFTFSVLTFLWKDNPYFKFGQQFIIGAVVAHNMLFAMKAVYDNAIAPMTRGAVIYIIPIILGIMIYTRLHRDYSWLSKYPTSLLIGVGTGVMITGTLRGQIIDQAKFTVLDIFKSANPTDILNGVIILIGTVTSITFFIFTKEHKGPLGASAKIGRIFLMVSLGANWAGETVWYLTQVAGRFLFLYNEWIRKAIMGIA